MLTGPTVRALRADDDLHALTELIHAAYAPHVAARPMQAAKRFRR